MSGEHEAVRAALGRVGAWTFAFDARSAEQIGIDARALESLGYEAVWVPEGSSSRDIFAHLSLLATRSERITVCSGIANITARAPEVMAAGARTLADAFGERVVLGIGVGHEYSTEARGYAWERPLTRMRAYLERMDEAPWYAPKPRVGVRRCSRRSATACCGCPRSKRSVPTPTSCRSRTRRTPATCSAPSPCSPSS